MQARTAEMALDDEQSSGVQLASVSINRETTVATVAPSSGLSTQLSSPATNESRFASAVQAVVVSDDKSVNNWLKNATNACTSATTINDPGRYLIVATQPTTINSKFGQVHIAKGAVAFIVSTDDDLNILNLAEDHAHSVVLESNNDTKRLLVGQQLLLSTHDAKTFAEINQLGQISWRNAVMQNINGYRAFLAEFSVVSAIQQLQPLQDILQRDDQQSKRFINNLLKIAVLINRGGH